MITMTNGLTATKEFKDELNELIMQAFEFSFDKWQAKNVWNEDYELYSIIENGVMLANISVYKMKMIIKGEKRDYLQFGSVATREEHRGKGLSKKLMEHIFSIYPDTPCFLHGGDDVANFYPKFGFKPFTYKQPYIEYKLKNIGEMIKLDITNPKVDKYLKERTQYSNIFDSINQYAINWFHLLYGHQNNIYEIPQLADTYEDHMKETVERFAEYYKAISSTIKETESSIDILDLGCGTGLEIEGIFEKAPNSKITGIDMSEEMMNKLKVKYKNKLENIRLIKDSYLTFPFEKENYEYVVSCMTMHHFVKEVKLKLYKKIKQALKPGGKYIEGDYMVSTEEENECLDRYYDLMNSLTDEEKDLYHIDIPFTIETQKELLKEAGFINIEIIWQVENKIIMVVEV